MSNLYIFYPHCRTDAINNEASIDISFNVIFILSLQQQNLEHQKSTGLCSKLSVSTGGDMDIGSPRVATISCPQFEAGIKSSLFIESAV